MRKMFKGTNGEKEGKSKMAESFEPVYTHTTTIKQKNGESNSLKKIVSIVAVIATIILCVGLLLNNKYKKSSFIANGEIARSMTYEQVQDGDENIERK